MSDAIANPGVLYTRMNLAGFQGQEGEALRLIAAGEWDSIAAARAERSGSAST